MLLMKKVYFKTEPATVTYSSHITVAGYICKTWLLNILTNIIVTIILKRFEVLEPIIIHSE